MTTRFSRAYAAQLAERQLKSRPQGSTAREPVAVPLSGETLGDPALCQGCNGTGGPRKNCAGCGGSGIFKPPGSKYHNQRTATGYASKREERRAGELRLLLRAGKIRRLQEQVKFLLIPEQKGERACHYIADFVYEEIRAAPFGVEWDQVVEDAKGVRTSTYILKRKLMLHVFNIRIREV